MSTAGVKPGHTHELPEDLVEQVRGLHQRVRRATVINVINLLIVGAMVVFLVLFIIDRGHQRDAAQGRLRDDIHDGQCELLDAFPATPLLDDVRHRFGCGPGRPVEDFPPEVQRGLQGDAKPVAPQGVESIPALPGGAAQQPVPQPYYPTPGVAEPPATVPYPPGFPPPDPVQPTDPPPGPLAPVTGLVCDVTGVCLPG